MSLRVFLHVAVLPPHESVLRRPDSMPYRSGASALYVEYVKLVGRSCSPMLILPILRKQSLRLQHSCCTTGSIRLTSRSLLVERSR